MAGGFGKSTFDMFGGAYEVKTFDPKTGTVETKTTYADLNEKDTDGDGVPDRIDPTPRTKDGYIDLGGGVGIPVSPEGEVKSEGAGGGSDKSDPKEEGAAAADAVSEADKKAEEAAAYANRVLPELKGFDPRTFILMHAFNLVNLRNEKINSDVLSELDNNENGNDVLSNTLKNLKAPAPYAYLVTEAEEAENQNPQNAAIQCIGDPGTFLNFLTANPNHQAYLNSTVEQLSTLTPKIRLYKLFHQDDVEEVVEFAFETAGIGGSELEELLASNGKKRGYGVGIKSFNINFQSEYISTGKSLVVGDLSIYADSMDSLLKVRTGLGPSSELEYRFIDLAYQARHVRGTATKRPKGSAKDLSFEIVADIGLVSNKNIAGLPENASSISIKLNPNGHVFNFEQDGSLTLNIEFHGYLEKTMGEPLNFDIFATKQSVVQDLVTDFASYVVKSQCGGELATKYKQHLAAKSNANYKSRITSLNTMLSNSGKIYYIEIKPEVIQGFNDAFNSYEKNKEAESEKQGDDAKSISDATSAKIEEGFKVLAGALGTQITPQGSDEPVSLGQNVTSSGAQGNLTKEMKNDMEDKGDESKSAIRDCAINPNSIQVAYFYAGDLINLILKNITNNYHHMNIEKAIEEADKVAKEVYGLVTDDLFKDNIMGLEPYRRQARRSSARFKKFRLVLGPTSISDFFSEREVICSIGDIPIPLVHFNSWLAGKMEGKKRTRYSLYSFLNDFIKNYIKSYLQADHKLNEQFVLGQPKFYMATPLMGYPSAYAEYDTDPLTLQRRSNSLAAGKKSLIYELVDDDFRPLIRTTTNKFLAAEKSKAFDYLVFHEPKQPFAIPKEINRLPHYGIGIYQHGRDRGIVKDIQYQRTEIEHRKEQLMVSNGLDGLTQISEIFNASLTTFADLNVHIGSYIYIDPTSITPYLSKQTLESLQGFNVDLLGVGGFFFVRQVQHSFEQGRFETTISTEWQPHVASQNGKTRSEIIEEIDESDKAKNPDEVTVPEENESFCKAFGNGPINTTQSSTEAQARSLSDTFLGSMYEKAVALFKAIFDNSDGEPTAEELGAAFDADFKARKAGLNPDEGSSEKADNGG